MLESRAPYWKRLWRVRSSHCTDAADESKRPSGDRVSTVDAKSKTRSSFVAYCDGANLCRMGESEEGKGRHSKRTARTFKVNIYCLHLELVSSTGCLLEHTQLQLTLRPVPLRTCSE